ncbi:MAG: maleylacetoacetate isomerase [Paracoccaceae bacterium]|nr:MAG: maleylacetoacetate isomerase [Paracoccaceae bacterium]
MAEFTLYGIALSAYVAKVRIVLEMKRADHVELPPPDGYGSAAYRAIVPAGSVPGLVHGDVVLSDSNAIAEYLDELIPDPPLMPADPAGRARVRMVLGFHDTRLEASARTLYPVIRAGWRSRPEAVAAGLDGMVAALERLEAMLADVPRGPFLSDLALPVTLQTMTMIAARLQRPLQLPPGIAGRVEAVAALPAVARSLALHRPALAEWLDRFDPG